MTPPICYASLAIYSKRDILGEIGEILHVAPVRASDRRGIFSWIYSTQGAADCRTVEQHLVLLKSLFEGRTRELMGLSTEASELRVWIYFGINDVNQSFIVSPEFIDWIRLFRADICVDVWGDCNESEH